MTVDEPAADGGPHDRGRIARLPLLGLLAALALAAAGCGGDSGDDDKANQAYADGVCTAVGEWKQQLTSIVGGISVSNLSKQELQSKLADVEAATKTLATDVKAVAPPDSSDGKAAKQQVEQFSADATRTISAAESALGELQDNVSAGAIKATLAVIAPQVTALVSSGKATVDSLRTAGGSLSSAFKDTPSCKSLTG